MVTAVYVAIVFPVYVPLQQEAVLSLQQLSSRCDAFYACVS